MQLSQFFPKVELLGRCSWYMHDFFFLIAYIQFDELTQFELFFLEAEVFILRDGQDLINLFPMNI